MTTELSVQLFTVREALAKDLTGTLTRIRDFGYTRVEPYDFTAFGSQLRAALAAIGLTAPTAHADIIGQDAGWVFAAAQELGIGTVIHPHTAPERWRTAEDIAATATELNDVAKIAAGYGVRVGYHNHAHELRNLIEGTTPLELFAERLDDGVCLEVDTYWAAVAGVNPVALLTRLGDRVQALHIKDGPISSDTSDQVAVGRGAMPVLDIIAAAPQALRVVELDDSRGDRFQAIADSYVWLNAQGLA